MRLLNFILLLSFVFTSCSTSRESSAKSVKKAQDKLAATDSAFKNSQQKGSDLFASGTDPVNWTLEMDFDGYFNFQADDGTKTISTAVKATPVMDIAAKSYRTTSGYGPMEIMVYDQACKLNGKELSKKVEVTVNNKRYSGCGRMLYDYRLNNQWIVDSIGLEKQVASMFDKTLPWIEFNLETNRVTGNNGCSSFNGPAEIIGNRVIFGNISVNKSTCNSYKFDTIVNKLFSNQIAQYIIQEDRLIFLLVDDSKMVFKKKF